MQKLWQFLGKVLMGILYIFLYLFVGFVSVLFLGEAGRFFTILADWALASSGGGLPIIQDVVLLIIGVLVYYGYLNYQDKQNQQEE